MMHISPPPSPRPAILPARPRRARARAILPLLALLAAIGLPRRAPAQDLPVAAPSAFRRFALQLQDRLADDQPQALNDAVDIPGLVALITLGYEDDRPAVDALTRALPARLDWGQGITAALQAGGSYRLLRVRQQHRQVRALYRLTTPAGLNYHDLLLVRDAAGRIRIRDIQVYATGETISASLRRAYLLARLREHGPDALRPADRRSLDAILPLQRAQRLLQQGAYADALHALDALPSGAHHTRAALHLRLAAAAHLDAPTRAAADTLFQTHRPHDPSRHLILAEAARARADHAAADAAFTALDQAIGGDPTLLVYRGQLALADGAYRRARSLADQALRREPDLAPAHLLRIGALLAQADHLTLAHALTDARRSAGLQFGDLAAQPAFTDFLRSEPGRDWYADHRP